MREDMRAEVKGGRAVIQRVVNEYANAIHDILSDNCAVAANGAVMERIEEATGRAVQRMGAVVNERLARSRALMESKMDKAEAACSDQVAESQNALARFLYQQRGETCHCKFGSGVELKAHASQIGCRADLALSAGLGTGGSMTAIIKHGASAGDVARTMRQLADFIDGQAPHA